MNVDSCIGFLLCYFWCLLTEAATQPIGVTPFGPIENCPLLNALKKSLHLSRRKTCFAHPVLENFFFVYRGVSFETANRSSIPSNSFMRDNSNIPLPIAVLQQFLGLFSMRSTRLKIVFMFMPDILKYTPFRFFESHTYHGRKREPRQMARLSG